MDDSANVFEDLELILDRITPLYKHRMDDLSGQQQAIMDAIAMNWDASATKEIALKVRLESKAVAAQLKILEQNNLIHSIPADRKNKLYLITERFFNIWYLMRYGKKKSREQVRFLVRFLEEWCSKEELAERINKHISLARESALHSKGAYYMCEALAQCAPSSDLQHELIQSTKEYLGKASPELAKSLSSSDRDLVSKAFSLASEKKDLAAALRTLQQIRRQDDEMLNIYGVFYSVFAGESGKAVEYFRMAVDKGDAAAMHNLAVFYQKERQDPDKAEEYYLMAVDKGDAEAMHNLAIFYQKERRDPDKAEQYYLMAVDKGNTGAMNGLAWFYFLHKKAKKEALQLAGQAVELSENLFNTHTLAILLLWDDRYDESIETFRQFLELEPFDQFEKDIMLYLVFLLAKKQNHLLLELFKDERHRLRERFKPVYYALMQRMRDEYPKEYKKMGDELRQTVEEILAEADKMAQDYA
jgi:tetratricopeptide (TPR) repeat protein